MVFLFICWLILYIYIRLTYGFWYDQPVYHIYKFNYLFRSPGIICNKLPDINNLWINKSSIQTLTNQITGQKKVLNQTQLLNKDFYEINIIPDFRLQQILHLIKVNYNIK